VVPEGEQIGIIGITYTADSDTPFWYRVVRDAAGDNPDTSEENEARPIAIGWIAYIRENPRIQLDENCSILPLLEQSGEFVMLPSQPEHDRLAFLVETEEVFNETQIAVITNSRSDAPPSLRPMATLPLATPVVVTGIHPNRQYVQITYRSPDSGQPVTENGHWIRVRAYNEDNFGDLTVIDYTAQDFGGTTRTALRLEYIVNDSWRVNLLDDRTKLEDLVLPEEVLPNCIGEQIVNCLPPGDQNGCHDIFGCPQQPAFVLNTFKDEEDGGRGPDYCGAWASTHRDWHCGIDLVKQTDAIRNNTIDREVFTMHGGLVTFWEQGDATYAIRDREENYAREYQYVHLMPTESLVSPGGDPYFRGEYLASGSKLGNYGPRGAVGPIAVHVHYVEKIYVAYSNSESIQSLTEIRRDPADHEYEVRAGFAGNPPRYIPICHPDYDYSGYIQNSEGDGGTSRLFPDAAYEYREVNSCVPAQAIRLPPGVVLSSDGTLEGMINQGAANGSPYQVRIDVQAQCREGTRTGWIEFEWRIVP
jgi:hypothetical protein